MKKLTFILGVLFLIPVTLVWAEPRGGGFGGGGGFNSGGGSSFSGGSSEPEFHSRPSSSTQFRSMGIRTVPHYSSGSHLFQSSNRYMGLPAYGPRGGAFRSSFVSPREMSSAAVRGNMAMVTGAGFRGRIASLNVRENIVGHYYWHTYNGLNFCHYYDRWGCHWYGWNYGASFYWSCWWGNYWWWYDPTYYRWCYWYNGWWWWQNPDDVTVTYVYNNGQYIPEQPAVDTQQQAAPAASSSSADDASSYSTVPEDEQAPAQPIAIKTFRSKDGSRTVKLAGNDAFLSDTSPKATFSSKYLASGVTGVRYSKAGDGSMQVTLTMKDGSSESYDEDGNPLSNDQ